MLDTKLAGTSGIDDILKTDSLTIIKKLSIFDIQYNPLNNMNDDEEIIHNLADNIKEHGLKEPLVVYKKNSEEGYAISECTYVLLSGERRLRAYHYNYQKDTTSPSTIEVMVVQRPSSPLEEELDILAFNEHRGLTEPQLIELVGRYLRIWNTLKEQGKKPKGQQRDWIAQKLSIGQKRAEKYVHLILGKKTAEELQQKKKQESEEWMIRAENIARNTLQTKVKVSKKELKISFIDKDDLVRIFDLLELNKELYKLD